MTEPITIRRTAPGDFDAIWAILKPVIRAGETYPLARDMRQDQALKYWVSLEKTTFVAELDGDVVGTYYIQPNALGGGSHIANCGYVTSKFSQGRGVARAMCAHSLDFAKAENYSAMQFNFVIASNKRAIALWRSFGFVTLCLLPKVFEHPKEGLVDALVMFKKFYES